LSELVRVKWSDIDTKRGRIGVQRNKHSEPATHSLEAGEIKALNILQRVATSQYVSESERGGPINKRIAQHMIEHAGRDARIGDSGDGAYAAPIPGRSRPAPLAGCATAPA
jgi:integrase